MPRAPKPAVSQKQLDANRANAARSTGPRTPQGKTRSSQNARKHGFVASTFAVVRLEDLQEIANLRADLIAVYQPVNSQELFAIERLALTQQAILRAARLESGLFTTCLNESLDRSGNPVILMAPELAGDGDIEITRAQNRNYCLGEGFHRMVQQSNSWSLAMRYQAQAERHYRRAVEEFERLKALRPELPNEPVSDPQPEPKETTYAPENEPISGPMLPEHPVCRGAGRQACHVGGLAGRIRKQDQSHPPARLPVPTGTRKHVGRPWVSGTIFFTPMLKRLPALALLALGLIALAACKKSPPANVAATVNNRVITYAELDKQYAAAQLPAPDSKEAEDSVAVARLEVLRTLIDNEVMLQRAEKLGLMAQEADVEAKFNELKALSTEEEFKKQLAEKKLTAEELKAQIRRDLSIQRLFNKEITSHINITDKDVADFYNANKETMFNLAEPQIHIAQILVTPAPNVEIRNLKGDKAKNPAEAKKKIDMLVSRLKQGEDFAMLAQNYSEDPESAPNGGDLGFLPESAFEKANVELRKMVLQLQPGQVSPVIPTVEGYRILKVISKEPAGQREMNDPRVQEGIRKTLLNRKDSLYKAAYFEAARNEAKIINYYAASVLAKMTSE